MHLYFNGPKSIFRQVEAAIGQLFPDPEISFGSSFDTEIRMNITKFGDGYEQRSLDGINNGLMNLNFTFENRSLLVIKHIEGFLRGSTVDTVFYDRSPEEYFLYTPPDPYSGDTINVPRKWVCKKWSLGANQSNNYTLTGVFEEVADP